MNLIVAVDSNWGIGCRGALLARVRADMKNFSALTVGKTVVLGSKTLATFPSGKPLKNRTNIILSRREDFRPEGAVVVRSEAELLCEAERYSSSDIYVIGGASIYTLLLPHCDRAYITKFEKAFPADAYFPNLDLLFEWECVKAGDTQISCGETDSEDGMKFRFCEYRRRSL